MRMLAGGLWVLLTAALILAVVYAGLAPVLLLEAVESLPVIVYSAISSFALISLLVPNPRGKGGVMWMYWESLEHFGFPLLYLALSAVSASSPLLFQFAACTLLFLLYGFVFGRVGRGLDLVKVFVLVNCLLAFWSLPTLVLWMDYAWGVKGVVTWTFLSCVTVLAYLYLKRRRLGMPAVTRRRVMMVAVVAVIIGVLSASALAYAEENRIQLVHDIPKKVEVGSSVTVTLRFTDQSGSALEPDAVTVTVTNPFGFESQPPLRHGGVGVYTFTMRFDVEGAYYITVRANRYGYISYSNRFLVDCVKSKAFLEWLFALLNSPSVFAFIILPVSALLLYTRVRKRRKRK